MWLKHKFHTKTSAFAIARLTTQLQESLGFSGLPRAFVPLWKATPPAWILLSWSLCVENVVGEEVRSDGKETWVVCSRVWTLRYSQRDWTRASGGGQSMCILQIPLVSEVGRPVGGFSHGSGQRRCISETMERRESILDTNGMQNWYSLKERWEEGRGKQPYLATPIILPRRCHYVHLTDTSSASWNNLHEFTQLIR